MHGAVGGRQRSIGGVGRCGRGWRATILVAEAWMVAEALLVAEAWSVAVAEAWLVAEASVAGASVAEAWSVESKRSRRTCKCRR